MTIKVKLRGGLGNQLFLYSAGFALSQEYEVGLELHTSLLSRENYIKSGVSRWSEQISGFNHFGEFVTPANGSRISTRVVQSFAGIQRKIGDYGFLDKVDSDLFAYESNERISHFRKLGPNATLNSYCNSPEFFSGYEDSIRKQITTLNTPSNWYLELKQKMKDEMPIVLHVRWGDYLNLKHIYGEISLDYYLDSVGLLNNLQNSNQSIWLSSDDAQGAKEFLSRKLKINYVLSPPKESTPLEALNLLASGSSLVAANSSFSWWAAFIGDSTPKFKAIFPRPLFAPTGPPDPKNWLLPNWLQLGR